MRTNANLLRIPAAICCPKIKKQAAHCSLNQPFFKTEVLLNKGICYSATDSLLSYVEPHFFG